MESEYTLMNEALALTFDTSNGLALTGFSDNRLGTDYLVSPSPFFAFSLEKGYIYKSDASNIFGQAGVLVKDVHVPQDGTSLTFDCEACDAPLRFELKISLSPGDKAAVVAARIVSVCDKPRKLSYYCPYLCNFTVPGYFENKERMLGMVPLECGSVVSLGTGLTAGTKYIHPFWDSPSEPNSMEVGAVFDRDGGGGFFVSDNGGGAAAGKSAVNMTVGEELFKGVWVSDLLPGQAVVPPKAAFGVLEGGDWQQALDYHMAANRESWSFPDVPAWLRESGGIWTTIASGSGGAYQVWDYTTLSMHISHFDQLPELYDRRVSASGCTVLYINDFWEGSGSIDGFPRTYWNKGDYTPRADMGGAEAFKRGIRGVHEKGGKVILYVEAFIICEDTDIGRSKGKEWAARWPNGEIVRAYDKNFSMCAPHAEWQDYIAAKCAQFVREYDADGVWADSYGAQFGYRVLNKAENRLYTPLEWDMGVYTLLDKIRGAMREIKPDAAVLCECFGGQMAMHIDGGSSADYVWLSGINGDKLIASPARYRNKGCFFTAGLDMSSIVQVFAAGHSLALCLRQDDNAPFIKSLLELRREYKDAMVYGGLRHLGTGSADIGAYLYTGDVHRVVTAVNTGVEPTELSLSLPEGLENTVWSDGLSRREISADGARLSVKLEGRDKRDYGLGVYILKQQ